MKSWFQRVRAAIGIGVTWAAGWAPLGAVTGLVTGTLLGFPLGAGSAAGTLAVARAAHQHTLSGGDGVLDTLAGAPARRRFGSAE